MQNEGKDVFVVSPTALDVVVVGAAGIDTNVFLGKNEVDFEVEANFSQNLDYLGGAGGYSSRGFAQLGWKTGFIGYVGEDHNGKFIAEEFSKDGIEYQLFLDPQGTRRSVNIMYRDGRRKNFYDAKDSMNLKPDLDICREILARSQLVHFSIENWTRYLLPIARELGLTVACDLQDLVSLEDPYRQDFINYADILFFSAANFPDPSPLIEQLLRAKPERVIIVGMGSRGCALGTSAGTRFFEPVQLELPVVDTNGAGDGLAVGFLSSYYLEKGYSQSEAILRGQLVARYTCTRKASSSNLISRRQLNGYYEELKAGWPSQDQAFS